MRDQRFTKLVTAPGHCQEPHMNISCIRQQHTNVSCFREQNTNISCFREQRANISCFKREKKTLKCIMYERPPHEYIMCQRTTHEYITCQRTTPKYIRFHRTTPKHNLSSENNKQLYHGVLRGRLVMVFDFFFQSQTPNLKIGGSIPHAITSANLDFHHCV